ncbi:MAG: hypothetical protein KAT25_06160 [Sulfuriflexus sp.]|nr:hypothetical protein [Sulfuriflexus sp.]
MQSRLLMSFHLMVALFSIWGSYDLASSLHDDLLGLNEAALWVSLAMIAVSFIAIVALYKKTNWATNFAKTLAGLYIGIIAISLSAYFSS